MTLVLFYRGTNVPRPKDLPSRLMVPMKASTANAVGGFHHVRGGCHVFLARLFMLTADIIASIRTTRGHHSAWANYRGGR